MQGTVNKLFLVSYHQMVGPLGRILLLGLSSVAVSGCVTRHASPRPLYGGDAQAAPSMEILPQPDVPLERMTRQMRFAWLLAEQSFEVPDPPPPPSSPTVAELRQWTDDHLEPWLAKKSKLVQAARAELDAAAEQAHRQRIIAGALVGLMYEDVAQVILKVPAPRELDDDPAIRAIYGDVVEHQAEPYLEDARRAYRACSANAIQPVGMRGWSGFCSGRLDALPADGSLHSGETQVTVTVQ